MKANNKNNKNIPSSNFCYKMGCLVSLAVLMLIFTFGTYYWFTDSVKRWESISGKSKEQLSWLAQDQKFKDDISNFMSQSFSDFGFNSEEFESTVEQAAVDAHVSYAISPTSTRKLSDKLSIKKLSVRLNNATLAKIINFAQKVEEMGKNVSITNLTIKTNKANALSANCVISFLKVD